MQKQTVSDLGSAIGLISSLRAQHAALVKLNTWLSDRIARLQHRWAVEHAPFPDADPEEESQDDTGI